MSAYELDGGLEEIIDDQLAQFVLQDRGVFRWKARFYNCICLAKRDKTGKDKIESKSSCCKKIKWYRGDCQIDEREEGWLDGTKAVDGRVDVEDMDWACYWLLVD